MDFESLSRDSYAILAAMSYLDPDNIPEALFEPETPESLPQALKFCSVPAVFTQAIEALVALSLVKRDKDTRSLSLHRLVQTSLKRSMTLEQKQAAFNDAAALVAKAFPRRDTEVATLYLMWDRCATYLKHVISLKNCFREEHKPLHGIFVAPPIYCDLNNMCQRYLLELHSYSELEDLIEVNMMAMETLPKEEADGLRASLTSHKGQSLVFIGKPEEGTKWLEESYEIRRCADPFNPRESAWAASNVAMGYATLNRFEEAIKWHEETRIHFMSWAKKQTDRKWKLPADTTCYRGLAYFWAGQTETARETICEAQKLAEEEEPFSWAVSALVHFSLGNIERYDRNYEAAEAHYMKAQNLWLEGGKMRSDPFSASCMYRLGCTALDRGTVEAAIKHLRDALVVTEMRKANMVAEHARVLFKLSKALEQNPRNKEEARRKRDEAEHLLNLPDPNADNPGEDSIYDSLVCIEWR
ncbi:hypothetical protein F5Y10DRAFT_286779 [Nemania abortiva]|nr:hypothetical protein F5Y10DRAFT_286779 [Nemania abortiva]